MSFSLGLALAWLADKIGGSVVGEKVKQFLPWLNKAKKDVDKARAETEVARRELGKAEADFETLLADLEYQQELIEYLRGGVDNLKSRCAVQGDPVRDDFLGPPPKRKTATQIVKAKRAN